MTKRQLAIFESYLRSTKTSLTECYNKPSVRKKAIFNNIIEEVASLDGSDLRVISHNTNIFTVGYMVGTVFHYIAPTRHESFEVGYYA